MMSEFVNQTRSNSKDDCAGRSGEIAVEVSDVWKWFGDRDVLRGVDLVVHRGEVVAILGKSGGGKSTLLRLINQLETISSGTITLCGHPLGYTERADGRRQRLKEHDICLQRSRTSMVFQNFNLFGHLTARQNVMFGLIHVRKWTHRDAARRADELLAMVGLDDRADTFPAQLSGGQQQRAAIARALAMEPEVMLFDEPTSALDHELIGEVLGVIRRLASDGMTMIIVTHEISFALDVADRVVVMSDGQIIESGSPAEVIRSPKDPRTRKLLAHRS
jgi:polar amino acid transport system ATP-binding protein